jgi:hypothetical protein
VQPRRVDAPIYRQALSFINELKAWLAEMGLDDLQAQWSWLAETDSLWSITGLPSAKGNRLDLTEFFRGEEGLAEDIPDRIWSYQIELATDDVLDFARGNGRSAPPETWARPLHSYSPHSQLAECQTDAPSLPALPVKMARS